MCLLFLCEAGSSFEANRCAVTFCLAVWHHQDWNDLLHPPMQTLAPHANVCMLNEHVRRRSADRQCSPPPPPAFFDECKGIYIYFFSFLLREPDPTGSGVLDLWVLPALSHPQSTCTCRHFLNRCAHLPGTTAKPAVITCVKTRVQGITEGNRAIYKLLADCFKGCGSCTM